MLAAVERGAAYPEISRSLGVFLATIGIYLKLSQASYLKRKRETAEVAPRHSPGRTPALFKTPTARGLFLEQLQDDDPATLESVTASCGRRLEERRCRSRHREGAFSKIKDVLRKS